MREYSGIPDIDQPVNDREPPETNAVGETYPPPPPPPGVCATGVAEITRRRAEQARAELAVQVAKLYHGALAAHTARARFTPMSQWELLPLIARDLRIRAAADVIDYIGTELAAAHADRDAARAELRRLRAAIDEHTRICLGIEP